MTASNLIFGLHSVEAVLKRHPERVQRLCVLQDRRDRKMEALLQLAKKKNLKVEFVSRETLDQLSEDANHQGIVAFCIRSSTTHHEDDLISFLEDLNERPLLLLLDNVQDPHNLGACFRTADAAGVHAIIAPKDKSVGITPTVSKVASGAVETVPFFQVTNLARTMVELKEFGIWLYGAAAEGEQSIYQVDLRGPTGLVLGAEGEGLRRLTRDHCDALVNIPMRGSVASLNVSVATGVLLFEAVRQRAKL